MISYVGVVIMREDIPQAMEFKLSTVAVAECLKTILCECMEERNFAVTLAENRHEILKEKYDYVVTDHKYENLPYVSRLLVEVNGRDFQMHIRVESATEEAILRAILRGIKGCEVTKVTEKSPTAHSNEKEKNL